MEKVKRSEVFSWCMGFVGTGIGAGILFLPIQAGHGGIFCFILSAILAFTISYIAHKAFAKLIIDMQLDFPKIIQKCLGKRFSLIVTVLFLMLMLSYLSVYILGLNVAVSSYLISLNITSAPLESTWWFPLILLAVLIGIVSLNESIVSKILGLITFPLIVLLLLLSIYLIQFWDFSYIGHMPSTSKFIIGFFNNIPILIFASLLFPPISTVFFRYKKLVISHPIAEHYTYLTLKRGQLILIIFTVFFAFSCLMCIPAKSLTDALSTNLNIMVILGQAHDSNILVAVAPLIAIIALVSSFIGFYFGAKVAARNLIAFIRNQNSGGELEQLVFSKRTIFSINISIGVYLYLVALINFNIGKFLSLTSTPITALIMYLIPVIIFTRLKVYKRYRGFTYYTLIFGGILLIVSVPITMLLDVILK